MLPLRVHTRTVKELPVVYAAGIFQDRPEMVTADVLRGGRVLGAKHNAGGA